MSSRRSLASPGEVADYLQMPVETLKHWRYVRKGPQWIKLGGHVRYDWTDVEKWVQGQRVA